jgi:hypothetical protein
MCGRQWFSTWAQFGVKFGMPVDADALKTLVDHELVLLSDARVTAHIRALLVEPKAVLCDWDYGKPGEQFLCWVVLSDADSNTGIAYCENGFGPRNPWGLMWLGSGENERMSMGMDSGWFSTFLDAYFESAAAARLPIWRVTKIGSSGIREPVTDENSWETTWERVAECRKADPTSRYGCDHSITFKR